MHNSDRSVLVLFLKYNNIEIVSNYIPTIRTADNNIEAPIILGIVVYNILYTDNLKVIL